MRQQGSPKPIDWDGLFNALARGRRYSKADILALTLSQALVYGDNSDRSDPHHGGIPITSPEQFAQLLADME